jgi:arylsulfatase A-like enzyme
VIRPRIGASTLAAAALAWAACAKERPALPTLVLVTLDTTRADHLSTYGYERRTDPFLAELARTSRVFEIAVPSATWTLPSHVSMLTGLDPAEHGCWMKAEDVGEGVFPALSPETPLLTGRLRDAGYHQLAAVGGQFTSHHYGLLRDFDEWLDPGERWELAGSELNAWIFAALERRPADRPLFLFVNYFDAHSPYGAPGGRAYPFPADGRELPVIPPIEPRAPDAPPPPPEVVRDAIDQYDRELLVQDEALAALFRRLEQEGLLENALVIVTSDHGEMFGEQPGVFGHGCLPYEPVARVPLVVQRRPGGPVDRPEAPVSLANVAATLLAAAGLQPLPAGGGAPRFDLLALPAEPPLPYVEHRGATRWFGVLRGARYKYGRALQGKEAELLVDLEADPAERLRRPAPAEARAVLAELRAELESLPGRWAAPPEEMGRAELGPVELERLRALGYGGDAGD